MLYREQLAISSGETHFERPSVSIEKIEILMLIQDINMISQQLEHSTTIASEGVVGTSALTLVST